MRKVSHVFLVFILAFVLAIPMSLLGSGIAFADVQCTNTSQDCSFTGETDAFGSKKKKYAYSKQWKSTGAPVELTIIETSRKKDLFEKVNAKLQKKKFDGKWEDVSTISRLNLNQSKSFKNIEPNVTYRVAFYHNRTLNVANKIKEYKIKQKQPQRQSKINGKWDYSIEPEFDFSNEKINYKVHKNGVKKSATGNLSYQTFSSPTSYTPLSSGVSHHAGKVVLKPSSNLLPVKTHYAGESNPRKIGSKVNAKFIGSITGESNVFVASSSLDVYYHTTGNLKLKKEVKANGDVKLTISTPKHYPKPTKAATVYGPQWQLTIKQDNKNVDYSGKVDFNGESITYTIKKDKIDPSKKITVDMKLRAYDLSVKPESSSQPPSGHYKVLNIYRAHGIQSFKLQTTDDGGGNGNDDGGSGGNNDNGKKDDDKKDDDKKDKTTNKEAKIDLHSKILKEENQVEIAAKLKKVDQPKGDWTLTFNAGEKEEKVEKFKNKKGSISKKFNIEKIDKEKVKVIAKFTGEDKKGKINVSKEKNVKIKEDPPAVNDDAKIKLTSDLLEDDKVKITASLENAEESTGNWTLIFPYNKDDKNQEDDQKRTSQEESITETFDIKEITDDEALVYAAFKGKDKHNKIIDTELEEKIAIPNNTNPPPDEDDTNKDNGEDGTDKDGTKSDEEDVIEEVITPPESPKDEHGGKLPKTATQYGTGFIAGIFLLMGGGIIFYWRRRAR